MTGVPHRLGLGLVALVLLLAAALVDGWLPSDDDDAGYGPFIRTAGVGDEVDLRPVTLEVDSVAGSAAIDEYGTTLRSVGLFVVIRYTVVAKSEPAGLTFVELRDGRSRVWSLLHGRSQNICPAGPPGVPVGCVAFFEVPPDALSSLVLRFAPDIEYRYDTVADVALGLTDADARRFATAALIEIPGTTLGGR